MFLKISRCFFFLFFFFPEFLGVFLGLLGVCFWGFLDDARCGSYFFAGFWVPMYFCWVLKLVSSLVDGFRF